MSNPTDRDPENPHDYTDWDSGFDAWHDLRLSRMGNDTNRDEPVFHGLD